MGSLEKIKNTRRRAIFDGAFTLAVATVVTKILGLLYKMPLSRIIGDEGMGYFNSAYTVYTFFYILCSAGVPKALAIVISENDTAENPCNERRIVRSALISFFALGFFLTSVFIIFSDALCRIIGNSEAVYTMLTVAPSVLFVSVAGVAKGHLNGNSRLLPIAVSQLIEGGAKFFLGMGFALWGVRLSFSLPLLSAFTVLGITLGSAASAIYLLICSKKISSEKSYNSTYSFKTNRKFLKKILRIAAPLTLGAAVMSLSNMIDLAMIMQRLGAAGYTEAEASAVYGNYTTLAVPMFNLVISLVSPFFIAAVPILARASSKGDNLEFEEELNFTLKKTFFICVPSVLAFLFYSEEILALIFKRDAAILGAPLLALLAPALIFLSAQTLVNTALEARGFYRAPIISMLIGCIPKILISYFLIPNPRFGISAAPIGTLVSCAVGFFISLLILYKSSDVHVCFFREFLRYGLAGALAILITQTLMHGIKIENTAVETLISLTAFSLLYLLFVAILLFIRQKERKSLSICTKKESIN